MAFNNLYMAKLDTGLALSSVGAFQYRSDAETIANITASAYFNNFALKLKKNMVILIAGSNGCDFYRVTSADYATPVTVAALGVDS